jgi:hypothetical protein
MPLSQTRGPQNIVAVITSNQSYDRTITRYGKNTRQCNFQKKKDEQTNNNTRNHYTGN